MHTITEVINERVANDPLKINASYYWRGMCEGLKFIKLQETNGRVDVQEEAKNEHKREWFLMKLVT